MLLKQLLFILFFWFQISLFAQKITTQFSEKIQSQSKFLTGGMFVKSLPIDGANNYYLFEVSERKGGFFIKDIKRNFVLIKSNAKQDLEKESTLIQTLDQEKNFIDFVKLKDKYYMFFTDYNKDAKTSNVIAMELNVNTLQLGKPINLTSFSFENDDNMFDGIFKISAISFNCKIVASNDSSKIAFTYLPTQKKNTNKLLQYIVVDKDLKKINEGKYDFGVYEKGMATSDIALDNNGKIYVSYKLNDAFTEKIKVAKGEDEMATYQPHLLSIDISKIAKDFSINCLNKLVGKCYINVNPNNEVSLNAFYEKKLNRGFIGFGSYNFNATNSNAVMMFTELSKDLIKQMDKDGSGVHDGLHWGFEFRNAFYFNNETTQLIFEKFLIEYSTTFSGNKSVPITNYEFGDILVVTLNKNNTMPVFTRVAKRQENSVNQHGILGFNPRKQIAYSFQPIIFKNELLLFYNDDADNIKKNIEDKPEKISNLAKSDFVMTRLDNTGKIVAKQAIYNHKDQDGYVTNTNFYETMPNVYAVVLTKLNFFSINIKLGTLTIKQ
ncbi:MAG: hypothetical protein H7178_03790 [Chitinophagaceae bacterium]|nr:hypothetical protein [Chitinophagaceae bacterium]